MLIASDKWLTFGFVLLAVTRCLSSELPMKLLSYFSRKVFIQPDGQIRTPLRRLSVEKQSA
jgi:hypothetical protein